MCAISFVMYCMFQGWNEGVVYLLRKGASQNISDKSGRTPLHASTYDIDAKYVRLFWQTLSMSAHIHTHTHAQVCPISTMFLKWTLTFEFGYPIVANSGVSPKYVDLDETARSGYTHFANVSFLVYRTEKHHKE